ncbi:MAG TPA: DNA (cytosine-5-)-methyltransferase, partial [Longimicrobium sp.]|nr:DNA (cytosine-5-)-methyltransferase [Longimicrobium sp.]
MRFVDLFAGTGAFHRALAGLGHECVFASELNEELRELYGENLPELAGPLVGDIRDNKHLVPAHDILCAGFPCQPFSKSGFQHGLQDATRGTLFHEILEILRVHRPEYVLLENVGNFARHDEGRTWSIVREELEKLDYHVRGTEHVAQGGSGLLSPHHFGFPHHRERFFIAASLTPFIRSPFPVGTRDAPVDLMKTVLSAEDLSVREKEESKLTSQQIACIDHWNEFLRLLPEETSLPSFPIWGDELEATYSFEEATPYEMLRIALQQFGPTPPTGDLLAALPSYARSEVPEFPKWKKSFIRQNRRFFEDVRPNLSEAWIRNLRSFPPSLRKLEWNCQGEQRNLWNCILQFRPSGLRAKRYSAIPALVAMTTTQIPILGPA